MGIDAVAGRCDFGREEEEDLFFDSREDFSSMASDSCPGSPGSAGKVAGEPLFGLWDQNPGSVNERRRKFLKLMGFDLAPSPQADFEKEDALDIDRIMSDGGAVLMSSASENISSSSSMSSLSTESSFYSEEDSVLSEENLGCSINNFENEIEEDGNLISLREVRDFNASAFLEHLMAREESALRNSEKSARRTRRVGWLRRLGAVACVVDRQKDESNLNVYDADWNRNGGMRRIKVRHHRKQLKEFSAVYMGQDFKAHDGAILTMKFSPDGQYLASGGEDGVVRVWCVMQHEWNDECGVPEDDPSCLYFTVNHNSELTPLYVDNNKKSKPRDLKRTSDSACVVLPPNVFRISEKPLHEFRGHDGDVLDLSWSKNKYLLSSSIDKMVCLWQVGCNSCLKVFSHNNYVTSIQFNPADENYFISGSIDGKIRIWEISKCRVVDWTNGKEIITAVCYSPDGKVGVIGTMTGDCRFYDTTDNLLQLNSQVSLQGRKKSLDKRITGFQFCPSNHRRLLVSSANSQVRILDGTNIVSKYKGLRNSASQISASFTSDGRHIISASEDSNVYVWQHTNQDVSRSHRAKSNWSCERFFSSNATVAIPWHSTPGNNTSDLLPSHSFVLSSEFFTESPPKGSATWPEESLPSSSVTASSLCKSQYKFLKSSCESTLDAWGQVVVTAGFDGRIRSFQNHGLPVHDRF